MYNCSKVGVLLPPAGSNVIPKASDSLAFEMVKILFASAVNVSNVPKLVGVNGLNFKDHTWYTFPYGGTGNPLASK